MTASPARTPKIPAYNITEFDETLVRRLIREITVYENRFAIEFKSGVVTEIIA